MQAPESLNPCEQRQVVALATLIDRASNRAILDSPGGGRNCGAGGGCDLLSGEERRATERRSTSSSRFFWGRQNPADFLEHQFRW